MPHENDIYASDQETGFGTGLRRTLERRRGDHDLHDAGLLEPKTVVATDEDAPAEDAQRSEAEELRLELEAALSREARLRSALAEQSQARERAEDLARELDRALAEVAALEESQAQVVADDVSPRRFLREQVERHVDALWQVFEHALDAVHADGRPDYATRLDAARTLLAEAYDVPDENGELPAVQSARDELAGRRARRAQQHPLL
jgi:hypothetical protein